MPQQGLRFVVWTAVRKLALFSLFRCQITPLQVTSYYISYCKLSTVFYWPTSRARLAAALQIWYYALCWSGNKSATVHSLLVNTDLIGLHCFSLWKEIWAIEDEPVTAYQLAREWLVCPNSFFTDVSISKESLRKSCMPNQATGIRRHLSDKQQITFCINHIPGDISVYVSAVASKPLGMAVCFGWLVGPSAISQ